MINIIIALLTSFNDVEWKSGIVRGDTARVTIYKKDHKNRTGYYVTDIYAMSAENQQIDSYRYIIHID